LKSKNSKKLTLMIDLKIVKGSSVMRRNHMEMELKDFIMIMKILSVLPNNIKILISILIGLENLPNRISIMRIFQLDGRES